MSETPTDQTTLATFTLPAVTENIAAIVGGSTAYIGSTAGSGGDSSTETVGALSFTPTVVPEPTTLATLVARRRRRTTAR